MSPRPRTVSDTDILAAVQEVILRDGVDGLTLAEVGDACGLAAPTLVQRFGSKRALLLAAAAERARHVRSAFAGARAATRAPIEAMLGALAASAVGLNAPESLAHHLAFQQMALHDGDFHRHALACAMALRTELVAILRDAVSAGELVECDVESVAQTVQTAWQGALATWSVFRAGTGEDWLRGEIEAVLEPFRTV